MGQTVNDKQICALRDLLEQVESLEGYSLTRDIEPYKAQAIWDSAIRNARNALADESPRRSFLRRLWDSIGEGSGGCMP